jgi:hypothetical protein
MRGCVESSLKPPPRCGLASGLLSSKSNCRQGPPARTIKTPFAKPRDVMTITDFKRTRNHFAMGLRRIGLFGLLCSLPLAASATNYTFPGSMPSGCSGSSGTYVCGSVTLNSADTVTIGSPKPATITFSALDTNGADINAAGSAADLNIVVTGTMDTSAGAVVMANVTAKKVSGSGASSYGGAITTTTGNITLGAGSTVAGALTSTSGDIYLSSGTSSNYSTVGSISTGGNVDLNHYNRVTGDVTGNWVHGNTHNVIGGSVQSGSLPAYFDGYVTVNGNMTSTASYVDIHDNSHVGGSITASSYVMTTSNTVVDGSITAGTHIYVYSTGTVGQCVRSTGSGTIYNHSGSTIGGACCGSGSTCTNTCVHYSPKPAACQILHHLELTTTSSSATANSSVTYTIKACANAGCSSLYTWGVTGTLAISGVTPTYVSGAAFSIPSGSSSTTETVQMTAGTATATLSSPSPAPSNSPAVFCGMGVAAASGNVCTLTISPALHHLELTTSASSGLTCTPITYTIKACGDASCATLYTSGVTGNLSVSGSGMTVNYPAGAGFSIGSGSSSTTVSAHITTVGSVTSSLSAVSPAPTSTPSVYCGIGVAASSGGSCSYSTAASGLIFNVPNHFSEVSQSITVSAVRSSDNATVCTPAFASASKSVLFKCNYSNPASGTKPVRVGGAALNSSNSASAACDATGRSVSLAFNASGEATTTVQYADVGQVSLTATYTGSGTDAGLSMTGTDTFIAAPYSLAVSGLPTGTTTAGVSFSGTVSAKNYSGVVTPNFGQESSPEGATLSFVRAKPTGSSAVNGSFSGSLGSFSAGSASASNLQWSEVGRGDVAAMLSSGNYLSAGLATTGGSSAGSVSCATEGGTCTLPAGATAMVQYGAIGYLATRTGVTGSIACTNAVFGDPINGTAKSCWYVVTSGAAPGAVGAVGPFIPHHLEVAATDACNNFTYSGQPFSVTVTARNAANATTQNYDGTVNTSPNHAKAAILSTPGVTTGTLTNASLGASTYMSGVASILMTDTAPVSFAFTSPPKAVTAVTIRATDTDSVSSAGQTEGNLSVRSGRLKLSNAFGSEKGHLTVPVQAQYWSGASWLLNSDDSGGCTHVPAAAVALSDYVDYKSAHTTAWRTTASAISIAHGSGNLILSTPTLTGSASASDKPIGSVSVALNLGSTTADNACQGTHPTTAGAKLSWLRSLNGSCSATHDRDPSSKATFGVYAPESKKVIHIRELF